MGHWQQVPLMYDRDQESKILCNVGTGRELLDPHNESHAKDVKAMIYLFPHIFTPA
jgi:hypothetical protein